MNNKFKRIRRILTWSLVLFGLGLLILIYFVDKRGLIEWQDLITQIVRVYNICILFLLLVFIFQAKCGIGNTGNYDHPCVF